MKISILLASLIGASSIAQVEAANCDGLAQYQAGTSYAANDSVVNMVDSTQELTAFKCLIAGWCSSTGAWAYEPGNGMYWQMAWESLGACGTAPGNQDPVAEINGPYSAKAGEVVNFSSRGSRDPDGQILGFSWNFGDGNTSEQENPAHAYATEGNYDVTLTVTDNQGATHRAATRAQISATGNQAPVAQINGPYSGRPNQAIAFSSAGSADADGQIVSYAWDFGDGASSADANPSHSYAQVGSYNLSLTVTDNEGASSSVNGVARVTDGQPSGKILAGYFTNWGVYGRNYHVKNIVTSGSAEKLTHILYAFGNVQGGRCVIGDAYADYDKFYGAALSVDGKADTWDAGALRGNFNQLRKLKQMYPHIKVVWSFGGWTWSGGFGQAAANPQAFADSCYDLVHDPRWDGVFDGIDIDWEYPNECGLTCDTSGFEAYGNLMSALRNRFGNELVTAAIGAGEAKLNAANYGAAAQYVDFYMLMTYDFFGAWAKQGPTAPHSPLSAYSGIPIPEFNAEYALNLLKSKGVSSDKILLGLGFYGRGWTGVTQAEPGSTATGPAPGKYEQGIDDYKELKSKCPVTGTVAGTAYAHCGNQWWSYDTPSTIGGKMNFANGQGLGGAFFWELSGDTQNGELIQAIKNGL